MSMWHSSLLLLLLLFMFTMEFENRMIKATAVVDKMINASYENSS